MRATTDTLIADYAKHQRVRGFSRRTIERRRWSLTLWSAYLVDGGSSIERPDVDDLEGFLARWESPQSRQSIRSDLHMFYAWAIERDRLAVDPTDRLPAPRVPQRAATPIARDDVRRLVAGCLTDRARLAVMLIAYAGLRPFEIGRLRGEDVHLDGRRPSLVVRGGKGDRDEVLPIGRELVAELRRWPRHGLLIDARSSTVADLIRRNMRRLGIAGRPYDLRHSFLTEVARKTGGNVLLTAQLARHKRIQTTVRYVRWHTTGHEVVTGLYDDESAA
jgi:integrase/recombinase XerD